jgi:hypothetical protein
MHGILNIKLGTLLVYIFMVLKMSDIMLYVDYVPFGFSDIQVSWCVHIPVHTFSCIRYVLLAQLVIGLDVRVAGNLTFFVCLRCIISLFFRVSVSVWALFAVSYCLLFTRYLKANTVLISATILGSRL